MALLPYIFDRYRRRMPNLFGLDISDADALTDIFHLPTQSSLHPWYNHSILNRDLETTIKSDKDKFQVNLDIQHFSPEELSVKTVDNFIIVEGKHKEKKDEQCYISRQFKRRYALPDGCKPETVESRLSSDGVLTILAPKSSKGKCERTVPVSHTGPIRKILHNEENQIPNSSEEEKPPANKKKRSSRNSANC